MAVRFHYKKLADTVKTEFMRRYPDYVFNPRRPGEKKRRKKRQDPTSSMTNTQENQDSATIDPELANSAAKPCPLPHLDQTVDTAATSAQRFGSDAAMQISASSLNFPVDSFCSSPTSPDSTSYDASSLPPTPTVSTPTYSDRFGLDSTSCHWPNHLHEFVDHMANENQPASLDRGRDFLQHHVEGIDSTGGMRFHDEDNLDPRLQEASAVFRQTSTSGNLLTNLEFDEMAETLKNQAATLDI
jgi:hypothetical protein